MLTISKLSGASKATRYLCNDNYYTRDDGVLHSEWQGEGAKLLGLSGKIKPEDFEALLLGKIGEQQLGNIKDGKTRHRPGWDLTLSAPKSVSILSEVYKDGSVSAAHQKAVKTAMRFVEQQLVEARLFSQGQVRAHKTENAIIASFTHDVSRSLDPQLHTHNIIINATQTGDKWRSVSPEKLYDFQKDIGRVYRSELARELKLLGYSLKYSERDHTLFEIKGFSEGLLKSFSQRAGEIEAFFKDNGIDYDTTLAKQIALKTRKVKKDVDREVLLELWKTRLNDEGFDLKQIKRQEIKQNHQPELSAKVAVNRAIKHISEREMSFNMDTLKKEAFRLEAGNVSYVAIYNEITNQVNKGKLLAWGGDESHGLWTTRENKAIEEQLIHLLETNRNVLKVRIEKSKMEQVLKKQKLNDQQFSAVVAALSSKDRFFAIQGDPGVGKTYTLNALKDLAIKHGGYDILAMASTHQAVGELTNSLKIEGVTVDHYLHNPQRQAIEKAKRHSLWVIDEPSMLSTEKINEIMDHAVKQNAKVVFVGDHNQLESVGAGRGFFQMIDSGVDCISLDKRMRQKDAHLDQVVSNILKKNYAGAINLLQQSGDVIASNQKSSKGEDVAISNLVDHWFSLDDIERNKTTIVAPANDQHQIINEQIRSKRIARGELSKSSRVFQNLQDKYITNTEKTLASSYTPGDKIRFTKKSGKTLHKAKIEGGLYYEVLGVNPETNIVALRDKTHRRTVYFDPADKRLSASAFNVYQTQDIALSKGDKIRFMDTDRALGLKRNESLTVERVRSDMVRVKRANGQSVAIALNTIHRELHVKYNYAKTSYGVQGVTTKNVLALMQSWRKNTTNAKAFMVAATRATHNVKVFTDNKDRLIDGLTGRAGENTRALDRNEQLTIKRSYQQSVERKHSHALV